MVQIEVVFLLSVARFTQFHVGCGLCLGDPLPLLLSFSSSSTFSSFGIFLLPAFISVGIFECSSFALFPTLLFLVQSIIVARPHASERLSRLPLDSSLPADRSSSLYLPPAHLFFLSPTPLTESSFPEDSVNRPLPSGQHRHVTQRPPGVRGAGPQRARAGSHDIFSAD